MRCCNRNLFLTLVQSCKTIYLASLNWINPPKINKETSLKVFIPACIAQSFHIHDPLATFLNKSMTQSLREMKEHEHRCVHFMRKVFIFLHFG